MVVSHVSQANIPCRTRVENLKATVESCGIGAYVVEARLGADEDVEKPCCVKKVGAHERVWRAEEDEEDEVLDC